MRLTNNTILVTGGGSGIGAGFARAFHALGNEVVVAGRQLDRLELMARANPGMRVLELDVTDIKSIERAASTISKKYPLLNVLINNAGTMHSDNAGNRMADAMALKQVETNFLGPVRLTSALIPLLKKQPTASIIYNSSTVAFMPLAPFAVYSATKAAIHSYAMSQRFLLRDTRIKVQELVPPWLGTGLMGAEDRPMTMALDKFIKDAMSLLATGAEEVVVEEAWAYRNNVGPREIAHVERMNTFFLSQSY